MHIQFNATVGLCLSYGGIEMMKGSMQRFAKFFSHEILEFIGKNSFQMLPPSSNTGIFSRCLSVVGGIKSSQIRHLPRTHKYLVMNQEVKG
jgi:hypothetical protein